MAVSFDIQASRNRVAFRGSSDATASDAIRVLPEVFRHVDFRPGMALVWDFRKMRRTWTVDEIRLLTGYLVAHVEERGPGKAAVLVSRDVDYGMARVAQAFTGDIPRPLEVFRDPDAAEAWLAGD